MQTTVTTTISVADIASRRVLRLALGTGMSMAFSQLIGWPLSYISAVFTMFLLALPLPAPEWKSVFKFSVAIVAPAYLGMLLLPFMMHARWAGIVLVILSLFGSFYYSARGGSPVLGMFITIGLTLVVTVGSVSPEAMKFVVDGIAVSAIAGISFVVIAHVLLPDVPVSPGADAKPTQPIVTPSRPKARKNALRSLSVVLPLVLIFLFIGTSTSYVVIMIKVASMGQQASVEATRTMGQQQLQSTLWGGLGAILGYLVISISPSLLMFSLIITMACLVYGRCIFKGQAMHPLGEMWSYALLTMIIILTPAVTSGSDIGSAFWTRLMLFIVIAVYGTIAVAVFDAFWPNKQEKAIAPG